MNSRYSYKGHMETMYPRRDFVLILYVPVSIFFQLCREGPPEKSQRIKCFAKGHSVALPVRLVPRSQAQYH